MQTLHNYLMLQLKALVPGVMKGQMLLCALWTGNPTMLVLIVPAIATMPGVVTCRRTEIHVVGQLLLRVVASEPMALSR
jgi:hypothetical protein